MKKDQVVLLPALQKARWVDEGGMPKAAFLNCRVKEPIVAVGRKKDFASLITTELRHRLQFL